MSVGLVDLINRANVRVIQGSSGLGFVDEAALFVLGAPGLGGEELEGDSASKLGILGFRDDTYPATA